MYDEAEELGGRIEECDFVAIYPITHLDAEILWKIFYCSKG